MLMFGNRRNSMTAIADLDGAKLAYTDVGTGIPLLCLHGGMGIDSHSLRVPGILELIDHRIRLVIPDQRGHGRSGRSPEADCTHATWASDARGLAQHLGWSRFAMLGHSYGGFLALEYAVRWPESLTHLVLVATSAGPVRIGTRVLGGDSEVREHFRQIWPLLFVGNDKHWALFDTLGFSVEPYNAAFARELPVYDLRDRVAELDVPMLLLVGDGDGYRPQMEWLASHAKRASLVVFDRVGHFPFIEARDEFVGAVTSFLRANVQTAA